jgi:hypothetical protein
MRLAITGAYGSGKSTLADAAAQRFDLQLTPIPPMRNPLGVTAEATACTPEQLAELVVRRLIDRTGAESAQHSVSDGSLLHDWVFAKTLILHGAQPRSGMETSPAGRRAVQETLGPMRRGLLARLASHYDVVVHLPIEFAMTEPSPPINETFRERTDCYLLEELENAGIRPYTVAGALPARVDRLHDLLGVRVTS